MRIQQRRPELVHIEIRLRELGVPGEIVARHLADLRASRQKRAEERLKVEREREKQERREQQRARLSGVER